MVASSCSGTPESGAFRAESVGNAGFLARHNGQIFAEGRSFSGNERDKVFVNDGSGRFVDLSSLSGADSANDGRAAITFDADDDGDLDLFVHETQRERHALYRNDVADGRRGVKIRLAGRAPEAIGAVVTVTAGGRTVSQVMSRGAGFVTCQAPELVFGLGDATEAVAIVRWLGGATERFEGLEAGGCYLLEEGTGEAAAVTRRPRTLPDPFARGMRVRVGESVARVAFQTADGTVSAADFSDLGSGERAYVNLWASYCRPCVGELPLLERWSEEGDARVLVVSVDAPAARDRARALLAQRAPALPALFVTDDQPGRSPEPGALSTLVDLARLPLPTTLVLGEGGRIEEIIQRALEEGADAPR